MASLQIETPPLAEPVALAVMKNALRVDVDDDDTLIGIYMQAAREAVEGFTGRSLVNKGYVQSLDSFPYFTDSMMSQMAYPPAYYSLPRYSTTLWNYSQMIKLFMSPLVKVSRIEYLDSQSQTWQNKLPAPFNWQPCTIYSIGDQIEDSNGNLQQVTAATGAETGGSSKSGTAVPTWSASQNSTTTDGDLTWTNKGLAPEGDFIYDKDSEPPRLFPMAGQFWPSVLYVPNAVRIHHVAGYGNDGTAVPACAKVAIMQMVGNWYENRESVSPEDLRVIPNHLERLLWNIRVLDFQPTRG